MTSTEFPSFYSLLGYSTHITKNLCCCRWCAGYWAGPQNENGYRFMAFWERRNPGTPQVQRPQIPLEETEVHRSERLVSSRQSADHYPSQGGCIHFLRCGAAGPKCHVGLSGRGPDSPLRVARPAGPASWGQGHTDTALFVLWDLEGAWQTEQALWPLTLCVTGHLSAGLAGPAISFSSECGSIQNAPLEVSSI